MFYISRNYISRAQYHRSFWYNKAPFKCPLPCEKKKSTLDKLSRKVTLSRQEPTETKKRSKMLSNSTSQGPTNPSVFIVRKTAPFSKLLNWETLEAHLRQQIYKAHHRRQNFEAPSRLQNFDASHLRQNREATYRIQNFEVSHHRQSLEAPHGRQNLTCRFFLLLLVQNSSIFLNKQKFVDRANFVHALKSVVAFLFPFFSEFSLENLVISLKRNLLRNFSITKSITNFFWLKASF